MHCIDRIYARENLRIRNISCTCFLHCKGTNVHKTSTTDWAGFSFALRLHTHTVIITTFVSPRLYSIVKSRDSKRVLFDLIDITLILTVKATNTSFLSSLLTAYLVTSTKNQSIKAYHNYVIKRMYIEDKIIWRGRLFNFWFNTWFRRNTGGQWET